MLNLKRMCNPRYLPSLRELFMVCLILVGLSTLLTYQIGLYQPWMELQEQNAGIQVGNTETEDKDLQINQDNPQIHIEGLSNGRRLSQASKSAQILAKIIQVEDRLKYLTDRQQIRKSTESIVQQNGHARNYSCSTDPMDVPYLSTIRTEPDIKMTPSFDPYHEIYTADVEYDVFIIGIQVLPKSCYSRLQIDGSLITTGLTNYTLGLGENSVRILVTDSSRSEQWVVNTYTLKIHRHRTDFYLSPYSPDLPLHTCTMKQDCGLLFSPQESCGLSQATGLKWNSFLLRSNSLPLCTVTDSPAQWHVPCGSCDNRKTCYWSQALWQAEGCSYRSLGAKEAQHCLTGKKLLFIGDSTNRGILHYIIEKINGSLTEWDKTHHLKMYSNINVNKTMFSFGYYPLFWLPQNHRPGFDKTIYQLIKTNLPLENNSNTVLVVGGVHWLGKIHLDLIQTALQREKLTGIHVIIKGLGSGFHQLVDGVKFASLEEQQKLTNREKMIANYSRENGFSFVGTYNMTMSRYKDFLQGRCACHFHKVSTQYHGDDVRYHVEGDVNTLYSEIALHQICRLKDTG